RGPVFERLLDLAARERRVAHAIEEVRPRRRETRLGRGGKAERPSVDLDRVVVGEKHGGTIPRAERVVDRLLAIARQRVVACEILQHLVEPASEGEFDRRARAGMELGSGLVQETAVGDVTDQGLREREAWLRM